MRADGYLTRSGVFVYQTTDGARREYRPQREVFDEDSLRTFALVPITDDHPPEMLDSRNARKYAVGAVGEQIRKDGDKVAAPLVVFDEDTIRKMQGGKVSLSCGYQCDLVHEPGETPDGEKYDAIQTNIRGNHVAIVDNARAGREARVRMDDARRLDADVAYMTTGNARLDDELSSGDRGKLSDKDFAYPEERKLPLKDRSHVIAAMGGHGFGAVKWDPDHSGAKKRAFNKILSRAKELGIDPSGFEDKWKGHLDNRSHIIMADKTKKKDENHAELLEAAADQVAQATRRADEAESALAAETRRADEAEGAHESLRTRVTQLEESRIDESEVAKLRGEVKVLQARLATAERSRVDAESPDRLRKAVKARVGIEKMAETILSDTSRIDTLNDREVMCLVVEKLHAVSISNERSDDYVRARFDSAVEQFRRGAEALGTLRSLAPAHDPAAQRVDSKSARQAMIDRAQDAWKKPLSNTGADQR